VYVIVFVIVNVMRIAVLIHVTEIALEQIVVMNVIVTALV